MRGCWTRRSLPTLVIDDDDVVRKTCVELLEARGHKTLSAASVGEGLRLFAEHRPAAVLLDLRLPDGTGIDVLRELQRQAPGHSGGRHLRLRQRGARPSRR